MIGSILTCVGLGIVLRPILNIEPVEIMPLVIGIAFVIDYVFLLTMEIDGDCILVF